MKLRVREEYHLMIAICNCILNDDNHILIISPNTNSLECTYNIAKLMCEKYIDNFMLYEFVGNSIKFNNGSVIEFDVPKIPTVSLQFDSSDYIKGHKNKNLILYDDFIDMQDVDSVLDTFIDKESKI